MPRRRQEGKPASIEEALHLARKAMARAGIVSSTVTPEKMRQALLETNLAAEFANLEKTIGLKGRPIFPAEWGWPSSWIDSLFDNTGVVKGLALYSAHDDRWRIVAVCNGNPMVDRRTGQYVTFESAEEAKREIDRYMAEKRRLEESGRLKK